MTGIEKFLVCLSLPHFFPVSLSPFKRVFTLPPPRRTGNGTTPQRPGVGCRQQRDSTRLDADDDFLNAYTDAQRSLGDELEDTCPPRHGNTTARMGATRESHGYTSADLYTRGFTQGSCVTRTTTMTTHALAHTHPHRPHPRCQRRGQHARTLTHNADDDTHTPQRPHTRSFAQRQRQRHPHPQPVNSTTRQRTAAQHNININNTMPTDETDG
jgi:hypothetical protein